jgi:hypothetical protein
MITVAIYLRLVKLTVVLFSSQSALCHMFYFHCINQQQLNLHKQYTTALHSNLKPPTQYLLSDILAVERILLLLTQQTQWSG